MSALQQANRDKETLLTTIAAAMRMIIESAELALGRIERAVAIAQFTLAEDEIAPPPGLPAPPALPPLPPPAPKLAPTRLGFRGWSDERIALLTAMWPAGETHADMLAAINALPGGTVTTKAVRVRACLLHLKRPPTAQRKRSGPQAWSDERIELLKAVWRAGETHADMMAAINALPGGTVTFNALKSKAVVMGLKRPPAAQRTSRGYRRWSDERIALLKTMWPAGETHADILAAINALPGGKMTFKAVQAKAGLVDLKRPPVAQRKPSGPQAWSDERKALLDALWPAGTPVHEVHARLNTLPGTVLTSKAVQQRAKVQELRRPVAPRHGGRPLASCLQSPTVAPAPSRCAPAPERAVAAAPPPAKPVGSSGPAPVRAMAAEDVKARLLARRAGLPAKQPAGPADPPKAVVADIDQIRGFCDQRGVLREGFSVEAANVYRRRLGLPPFRLGVRARTAEVELWAMQTLGRDAPLFVVNAERTKLGMPLFLVDGSRP